MPADVSGLESLAVEAAAARGRVYRNVTKVVAKTTDDTAQTAKGLAPVRTGALRDSIKGTSSGLKGTVEAGDRAGPFMEFGTYKDSPQPFMAPAADKAEGRFAADAQEAAASALEG